MIPSVGRTVLAGLAGGLAFVLGTALTFAQLSGSRRGQTGLLFDPATQSPKVIAVWKEIEPLPRVLESPLLILGGMVLFGLAYAFVYRSISVAWPKGIVGRGWRLALIVWIGTVFSEFIGPFNVLHQPLSLSAIAWAFWAVAALLEGYAIAYVAERGQPVRLTRMTDPRLVLAASLAAATLALFLAVIAMGGALRAGLAPWPGIAVVVMATAAFVLSGKQGSFLVAGLLAASGAVGLVYGLVATEFLAAATFPGPVFGVIIGLPVLGLGLAGVATARAGER